MRNFKTSMDFMRKVYKYGLSRFSAPKPIETDVLCDELKITFNRNTTFFELIQDGSVIGEMRMNSQMNPGDSVSLCGLKLYWTIEFHGDGE